MSPGSQRPSSRGWEIRKHRPPQSTQTISFSGSTIAVCLTYEGRRYSGQYADRVRVVAGTLRGRTLVAPEGSATRPTTDRTREAVFNALSSLGVLEGAVVVDLFAGSGALGIEALSRGATSCVFVESDSRALATIRQNLKTLDLEGRSEVVAGRVETVMTAMLPALTSSVGRVDLVFADPPYGYEGWDELTDRLESVVAVDAIAVIESGTELEPSFAESSVWNVIRSKRYGRTWVTFLQHSDAVTD